MKLGLSGLQDNCSFDGPNPRQLSVTPGNTAVADYEVRCSIPYRILFQSFTETSGGGISSLNIMNSDGSDLRTLISEPGWWGGDAGWSPDGRYITYWKGRNLVRINSDGSAATIIYTAPADVHTTGGPKWSPDATRISFILWREVPEGSNPRRDLYVIRSDGSEPVLLSQQADDGTWSPDGLTLQFTEFDPDAGVYLIQADGTRLRPLAAAGHCEVHGPWSPDGASIAIVRTVDNSGCGGPLAIYLVDAAGTNLRQLTQGPDYPLDWSPDGSKLLFAHQPLGRGTNPEIHVINPNGSEDVTLLDEALPGGHGDASWSPDGRAIAWSRTWGGETGIYIMNPDGSRKMRINGGNSAPRWEPVVPGSP